ncbi:MAG: NAD(P)H-dependent oxidoreductase [Cypionkella sp.]
MTSRRFLFLQSSARAEGNSAALAHLAASFLPADAVQEWRDLNAPALPAFHDLRHGESYGPLEGLAADLAARTLAASDIVFMAPLYWYGLPAPAKLYLDHWSHWLRLPELGFKSGMAGKTLWLVMAHSGSTPAEIAPAVDTLRFSAAYMGMAWGGVLLADANAPGDWQTDQAALTQARGFFTA